MPERAKKKKTTTAAAATTARETPGGAGDITANDVAAQIILRLLGESGASGGVDLTADANGLGGLGLSAARDEGSGPSPRQLLGDILAQEPTTQNFDDGTRRVGEQLGISDNANFVAPRASGVPFIFTGGSPFPASPDQLNGQRLAALGAMLTNSMDAVNSQKRVKQIKDKVAQGNSNTSGSGGGSL